MMCFRRYRLAAVMLLLVLMSPALAQARPRTDAPEPAPGVATSLLDLVLDGLAWLRAKVGDPGEAPFYR